MRKVKPVMVRTKIWTMLIPDSRYKIHRIHPENYGDNLWTFCGHPIDQIIGPEEVLLYAGDPDYHCKNCKKAAEKYFRNLKEELGIFT